MAASERLVSRAKTLENLRQRDASLVQGSHTAPLETAMGLVYLLLINVVTLCVYGVDKSQARRNAWRIRESTLHLLALLGGTPGALAGQVIFRHKTRDHHFQIVFAAIVILQVIAAGAFFCPR